MKKVIAFDIDDTLNVAKTPMPKEMAEVFAKLLDYYPVCVISGQKVGQFMIQIVNPMDEMATPERLKNLHLMTAQGTQYYVYKGGNGDQPDDLANWNQVYTYPMTDEQITKITEAIEQAAKELGYWCENPAGEIVENRDSQVTFSALGQAAKPEDKYPWDPDHHKRNEIAARARELAPEFDYEVAGTTSINVFLPGMNKTFGMTKLMEQLGISREDILYFGDMTQPGGNDYPVVEMGIETVAVRTWEDTLYALRAIVGLNK